MIRTAIVLVCLVLTAGSISAQSAILERSGKTVEVVGLHRWTIRMVEDSLAKYAPGTSLTSHSCAAKLRYNVGFADAANFTIRLPDDSTPNTVVVLVEPQDSGRTRFRRLPLDRGGVRREWRDVADVVANQHAAFRRAAEAYLLRDRTVARDQRDSAALARVWSFLDAHRLPGDARLAREVLLSDPSLDNRVVAAVMLLNFSRDDSTWWALVEAMREPDGMARSTATLVLQQLAEHAPRRVDWRPASPAIHAMLEGTSVAYLRDLMHVLVETGVGQESAPALVGQGGHMLLSFAGAQHPVLHLPARRLLKALSGADHGADMERWTLWLKSLPAPKQRS